VTWSIVVREEVEHVYDHEARTWRRHQIDETRELHADDRIISISNDEHRAIMATVEGRDAAVAAVLAAHPNTCPGSPRVLRADCPMRARPWGEMEALAATTTDGMVRCTHEDCGSVWLVHSQIRRAMAEHSIVDDPPAWLSWFTDDPRRAHVQTTEPSTDAGP
jgi:hypothetical protein